MYIVYSNIDTVISCLYVLLCALCLPKNTLIFTCANKQLAIKINIDVYPRTCTVLKLGTIIEL